MFITGLGTALPQKRFTQAECWKALQAWEKLDQLKPRSRAILKKVLLQDNGIASRHLALEQLAQAFEVTPNVLHARTPTAPHALRSCIHC